MSFRLAYLNFTFVHSKGKGKIIHIPTGNISQTLTDTANIDITNK